MTTGRINQVTIGTGVEAGLRPVAQEVLFIPSYWTAPLRVRRPQRIRRGLLALRAANCFPSPRSPGPRPPLRERLRCPRRSADPPSRRIYCVLLRAAFPCCSVSGLASGQPSTEPTQRRCMLARPGTALPYYAVLHAADFVGGR